MLHLNMFEELKIVNCQVFFSLLDKIKESGDKRYIPLLEAWRKGEVRKVREKIGGVIARLEEMGGGEE